MSKDYNISLYNHSVSVGVESEETEKLEQVLEPEFKYLREIAERLFGGEE